MFVVRFPSLSMRIAAFALSFTGFVTVGMRRLRRIHALAACTMFLALPAVAQPSWNDTLAFTDGSFGEMSALLEKTIFKVDVLMLRIRVDSLAAAKIKAFVHDDSVALAVIDAKDILAEIRFLREINLSQFLDGIDDDMKKAVRAGLLDEDSYQEIMGGLPEVFSFLDERKIQDGDCISYRVHADTLRTVYRDTLGTVLLDQVDIGRQRRQSVIATFLTPGSSFRKNLLRSLPDASN